MTTRSTDMEQVSERVASVQKSSVELVSEERQRERERKREGERERGERMGGEEERGRGERERVRGKVLIFLQSKSVVGEEVAKFVCPPITPLSPTSSLPLLLFLLYF